MVSTPVGYQRPPFPSLYWPLGPQSIEFQESFLYNFEDIWLFTTAWATIFMCGLYTSAAALYLFTHHVESLRHPSSMKHLNSAETNILVNEISVKPEQHRAANIQSYFVDTILSGKIRVSGYIVAIYIVMGALQGFVAGTAVGCMIAGIYNSGQFKITPWIPFTSGLLISIYNLMSAYSFTVRTL